MLLLILYVLVAIIFSFLCSIAEAVLLSVTVGHIAVLEQDNKPSGALLRRLKEDINKPLAAILTLNTIAHTVGAAGAGAQAAAVFGNAYLGVASAVLTLMILVFSEIIPKTLGAHYWKSLAPITAYGLRALVWLLYPFVKLSEYLTRSMAHGPSLTGFNRDEFLAMAELSSKEGLLAPKEMTMLKNLLSLRDANVSDAMTPRTVIFAIAGSMTVAEYFQQHAEQQFSRIPVYVSESDKVRGFVLKDELLLAHAQGKSSLPVSDFQRELPVIYESTSLFAAFEQLIQQREQILLVVNEYGDTVGILTLEDVVETMLGLEIVDEGDANHDMQELARRLWRQRADRLGLKWDE